MRNSVIDLPTMASSTRLGRATVVVLVGYGTAEAVRGAEGEVALTAAQAAGELGVSDARFRQLVGEKKIKPVASIAKAKLYRISEVEALKASRSDPAGVPA